MFLVPKEKEAKKDFSISCDCGCGSHIDFNFDTDLDWVNINLSEGIFYTEQKTIRSIIKDRIKLAWYCLRGKGFHFFDVMMTPEQWEEFKKAVNNVDMNKRLADSKKIFDEEIKKAEETK